MLLVLPSESRAGAREAFYAGFSIEMLGMFLAFGGVALSIGTLQVKIGNKWLKLSFKLSTALVGALLGLGIGNLFQVKILTDILIASRGANTLEELLMMYLVGSVCGAGITATLGGALAIAKAIPNMPKDWVQP